MLRLGLFATVSCAVLAACGVPQMTFAEAVSFCQEQADAAAGPQGAAGISVGTGGTSATFSVSLSDSFLRGEDPEVVYETCMNELSQNGQISGVSK